ncbi:MAG TPA: MMPL family transporter [Pirellulales bacterium]|jgi:RND superfamily putative drug exporter|nr:MMPL family transporter [Pirellulales bacterium]
MFEALGQFIAHRWQFAILAWVVAGVALTLVAPRWDDVTNDGDLAYMPDRMTSVRGEKLMAEAFPEDTSKSQIVLVVAREDKPLSSDDKAFLERLVACFPISDDGRFEALDANHDGQLSLAEYLAGASGQQAAAKTRFFRMLDGDDAGDGLLTPSEYDAVRVMGAWTPETDIVGSKLISRDQRAAIAMLMLSTEFMAVRNASVLAVVNEVLKDERHAADFPAGLELGVTGSAAIGGDTMASAGESIEHTEMTTIILVVVILALVYQSPLLVLIPLVTIGTAVMVSTELVALLTRVHGLPGFDWFNFQVFTTTRIFVVTILFGAGTDFCLFLISRYREELGRGLSRPEALSQALEKVGHAIAASAATTIIGLGTMVLADFGKFRNSGPAIGLCLSVALVACLTLAPALLRLFGPAVFWPFGINQGASNPEANGRKGAAAGAAQPGDSFTVRFWNRLSYMIIARPGLILVASVLAMSSVIFASRQVLPGPFVHISYNLLSDLDPQRPSIVGTRLVQRHFAPGELGPVTVLAFRPQPKAGQPPETDEQRQHFFNRDEGGHDIARLTKLLYELPGVDSVRSIAEPLGGVPGVFNPLSSAGRRKMAALRNPRTKANFLSQVPQYEGRVTRLDVVLKDDPFSRAAANVLGSIEQTVLELRSDPGSAWRGVEFDFVGVTAGTRDLQAVTQSDDALIQKVVTIAVLGILIVVLRRPLICLYLIASVLFSYYVAIAATQLVFSYAYPEFDGLDWKVPIFLFVILIAVGEDYNIFLATRVFEEQQRWGLLEGLRRAVVSTGGIITSCGVIMAGTFVSMMTGTLRGMLELGFALTLGVMLDTLIVRPILVPAFLAILWRRADARSAEAPDAPSPDELKADGDVLPSAENGHQHNGSGAGRPKRSELSGTGNR